jgi:hypothetical protein
MTRMLALTTLITVSLVTAAEERSYWVLGSYASESSARREADRLSHVLDAPIDVRFAAHLEVHRVLLPYDLVDAASLAGNGINAWHLSLRQIVGLSEEPEDQRNAGEARSVMPAPDREPAYWPPLYPPLNPGESLDEYCERRPGSALCTDPAARELLERARRLRMARERLSGVCEQISHPDHRQTCEQLQ